MTFFSCQKPEVAVPEAYSEEVVLTFTSEKPAFDDETKTEWTGETIQWSNGDKIRVAYTCDGVWQNANGDSSSEEENGSKTAKLYESTGLKEAGLMAKFTVPDKFKGTADGTYQFYGIYPSSLVPSADIKYAPSVTVNIPSEQTPSADSFDASADMMAAKSDIYSGIPKTGEEYDEISLRWDRLVAHGYFTLKNIAVVAEEDPQTITLTANAEADMVGSHYLYLDAYNVVKPNSNSVANKLTIDARNLAISEGKISFWACFLPCTWTSLTVEMETDKATYTRVIDLSDNQITFVKNARNTLGINMTTAERAAKSAAELPFVRDFSDKTGTSSISDLDGFSVDGFVYNASGAIRLAKADGGASVQTQLLDLSQNFQVLVTAKGWDSDELTLNVAAGDQSNNVTLTADDFVTYAVNFNPVSASSSVKFTTASGKRCYISRIEIRAGHDELPPVLKATPPSQMVALGGEASFTYTLINPKDGEEITAESNVSWITDITVGEGIVTYTVAENTAKDAREGVITLSYDGIDDVPVTISQAAAAEEGDGGEKTIVLTLNKETTGNTSTSYVNSATSFTFEGVGYSVANWNPNSLQIRGNKSPSNSDLQSAVGDRNFMLRNTTAIPGNIKSITITYTAGTIVANKTYAAISSAEITTQTTDTSVAGTAINSAVTWTFTDGGNYFAIGMINGGTSGTTKAGTITIVYDAN